MTAASKFRSSLLSALSPCDAARLIEALPGPIFRQTMNAMADGPQLAEILPWMGEFERQRAMQAVPPLVLRKAHQRLTFQSREKIGSSVSLAMWDEIAIVKDYEIQAWAHDLVHGEPVAARRMWADMDFESRARIGLILTDEQLDALLEILK